jgi:hypothetical protein
MVARQLFAEGGLPAFWRGTGPALVMVSNPVVQFAVYEWLMARGRKAAARGVASIRPGAPMPQPTAAAVFAAGALSKLAATLVTYPFLVIKSRQQAAGGSKQQLGGQTAKQAAGSEGEGQHKGAAHASPGGEAAAQPRSRGRMLDELKRVAREEGIQGACARASACGPAGQCVDGTHSGTRSDTPSTATGLYSGLDTKLVQTVLAAAILFTTKESITKATRRALRRRTKTA